MCLKNNMSQVFYRKYRPQRFEDVVGQENTIKILKNAVSKKRVAHAYLFSGPRGTGKTTVARILARETGSYEEDVIEIDAASSRGIDEARALREAVRTVPLRSKYKTYIIDEVHMLTKESFNALLKTLEEPPEHAIFILATTEPAKVPDTIISRTQHFQFNKVAIPDIVKELEKISLEEKLTTEDDVLKLIAFFADGSLRDAENILFQIASLGEKNIKEADVRTLLGAPEEESVEKIIKIAFEKNVEEVLKLLDKVLEEGIDPALLGKLLLRSLRAIYFLALDPKTERMLEREFSGDEITEFKKMVPSEAGRAEHALHQIMNSLDTHTDDYSTSLPLELALIKIATYK
ncbi:MAG: polymerase III, subunit gamma and tau protein [Candidatus Giovannonibacteria bacterium GW2011_GWC2_44_9]|uniref:DNA polymerase III subunit gamma/tau n=3 Tax=Candidatus Giovannoniibacteriota TaxID=1752738 RepID=A0A0G1IWX9_9BACT|nr:MAG: polymerase III, subunit gamma and tau protein [Candidatus Giovannonibacteria bacterium GW2011_GWB1_44_23]KKT63901.1 MAG: polymerase III, subunit gamma and tau protein [Candidatus Giovannonibacteria bacterium GW2011_GWA1_44_29]KKT83633.1 MAG: polymerase III, subunit gamma and tau protein [Candidatus Giovannonibacteria bacterium GW2011_GWC2_44_9]KKT91614.1 MAG: polymerase III, subunit gamma and tau protein [Parcubacteria group bacterium GW2011_GWC1_45_13]